MTDQGAYRAICKYAINLMPSSYLPRFQQTIDWVAGRMYATKLPVVMTAYNLPHTDQPVLDLFFRRSDDNSQPLCTAMLYVCDMCYLYVLPFADTDKACVTHMNGLDAYWQPFCQLLPCAIWKTEDMSDFDISTPWIEMSLPLTDGLRVKIVSSVMSICASRFQASLTQSQERKTQNMTFLSSIPLVHDTLIPRY